MQNYSEYDRPVRSRPRERRSGAEGEENGFLTGRVILTQLAVFSLLLLILFFVCRAHSDGYLQLRNIFSEIMRDNITASEAYGRAKSVMSYLTQTQKNTEKIETETETETETFSAQHGGDNTGAGGEDLLYPGDNVSFSPFFLSRSIVKPVVSDRVTSKFGYRENPVTGEYGFHSGLDMAAAEGSDIYAAFDGTVKKADFSSARGNYIFLESDGNITTVYCHCSELLVSEGEKVKAGQVIAKVGSTGQATGPHLHFEIRINGKRFNPLWILDF